MARRNVGRSKKRGSRGGKSRNSGAGKRWVKTKPKKRSASITARSKFSGTRGKSAKPSKKKTATAKSQATRAALAALKVAEKKIRQLVKRAGAAKGIATRAKSQVVKLKKQLVKARAPGKSAKARSKVTKAAGVVASQAAHAAPSTPVELSARLGARTDYSGPEVALPQRAWVDQRLHRTGSAVLGFLEGRPGIMNIRSVQPLLPPLGREQPALERTRTPELQERVNEILKSFENGGDTSSNLEDLIWDAYFDAEEFGAIVDYDVDSDSGDPS